MTEEIEDKMGGMCPHGNFPATCPECSKKVEIDPDLELKNKAVDMLLSDPVISKNIVYLFGDGNFLDNVKDVPSKEMIEEAVTKIFTKAAEQVNFLESHQADIEEIKQKVNLAINTLCTDYDRPLPEEGAVVFTTTENHIKYLIQTNDLNQAMIELGTRVDGWYDPNNNTNFIFVREENNKFDQDFKNEKAYTLIHEKIHEMGYTQKNPDGTINRGLSGFGTMEEYKTYGFLEEGFVDTLSYRYARGVIEDENTKMPKSLEDRQSYKENREAINRLFKHISQGKERQASEGFNLLANAHFKGEYEPLKQAIETTYGIGSFDFMLLLQESKAANNLLLTFLDNPKEATFFLKTTVNNEEQVPRSNYLDDSVSRELLVKWYDLIDFSSSENNIESIDIRRKKLLELNHDKIDTTAMAGEKVFFWSDESIEERKQKSEEFAQKEWERVKSVSKTA